MNEAAVFRVREPFAASLPDGTPVVMHIGDLVSADHPLYAGREHLFDPVAETVNRGAERATAGPAERRVLSTSRRRASGATDAALTL